MEMYDPFYELIAVYNGLMQESDTDTPQGALSELYVNVQDIKNKAALADTAIKNILDDPKKMDFAKSRLGTSSSSTTQIVALNDAFSELEMEVIHQRAAIYITHNAPICRLMEIIVTTISQLYYRN
jgi:hypothetical protein